MQQRRNVPSYEGYAWHKKHAEELREKARVYRATHPEYLKRNAEKAKADRLANPEYFRAREFRREMKKYSTTTEWYIEKLIFQNGLCAICGHLSHARGSVQRLQVDHDHGCCDLKTKSCGKCLRGLLCAECNMLLSYLEKFMEEAEVMPWLGVVGWVRKALQYLSSYKVLTQAVAA